MPATWTLPPVARIGRWRLRRSPDVREGVGVVLIVIEIVATVVDIERVEIVVGTRRSGWRLRGARSLTQGGLLCCDERFGVGVVGRSEFTGQRGAFTRQP